MSEGMRTFLFLNIQTNKIDHNFHPPQLPSVPSVRAEGVAVQVRLAVAPTVDVPDVRSTVDASRQRMRLVQMEFVRWGLLVDVDASAAQHVIVLTARPDANVEAPTSSVPWSASQDNVVEPGPANAAESVHVQHADVTAQLGPARVVLAVLDQEHAGVLQVALVSSKRCRLRKNPRSS
ncbi:hypothetical protein KP79_PYT07586 [Mizuhopecten yessoensis]|uniref:Uncharacterized protein n=1 Tax=Mizuhopecten yessoensis TaxID=6573 RepID=A0A210PR21_MIZYE|nr:hypothetical protein KP79_PYT07586 [Mizuhopecten yessoensis]